MVTKKISERSITKLFLENINANQVSSQEEDLDIKDIEDVEDIEVDMTSETENES